jgi:hypothetical protein
MENEDFRIITHLDREFKCFRDGRVFIKRTNWRECTAIKKAYGSNYAYRIVDIPNSVKLHRILGKAFLGLNIEDKKQMIDHIDGNGLNNSFENLRIVTNQENAKNYHTEIKAVQERNGKFRSRIGGGGKIKSPTFDTKEEALNWRREKEIELGYMTRANGI